MEMYKLPAGWEWCRLSDLTMPKQVWDQAKNPRKSFRYIDISSIDNNTGRIAGAREISGSNAPSRAKRITRTGDVLFATTRPYLKNVAIVPPELNDEVCSTGFCVLRPQRGDSDGAACATSQWIYHACRSDLVVGQVIPSQEKSAYPAVSDSEVLAAQIPVPPLAAQRRIEARIDELTSRLRKAADLHREAAAHRRTLLPSLVSNHVRRQGDDGECVLLGDIVEFVQYGTSAKAKWLGRGWISVSTSLRDAIVGRVWEIHTNAFEHSHSPVGIFSCGQHYPRRKLLELTVVDFGVGIPSNARLFVRNPAFSAGRTLQWAFQAGNTTKPNGRGRGMGLDLLKEFVRINKGRLEVFSHEGYARIDEKEERYETRPSMFEGTVLNISLQCDDRYYCFKSEVPGTPLF
jgi:hypothetical protein